MGTVVSGAADPGRDGEVKAGFCLWAMDERKSAADHTDVRGFD
jgi:hypothetical protein